MTINNQKNAKKADINAKNQVYYVNPHSVADLKANVSCTNSECVNFVPIHQACNLKSVLINAKSKCEFSVKRKKRKLNAYENKANK